MDKDLADQVAGIAARVVASGAISANGHGNVSVRVPGRRRYFTRVPPAPPASASPVAGRPLSPAPSRPTFHQKTARSS